MIPDHLERRAQSGNSVSPLTEIASYNRPRWGRRPVVVDGEPVPAEWS
jgi:hypothetical protein